MRWNLDDGWHAPDRLRTGGMNLCPANTAIDYRCDGDHELLISALPTAHVESLVRETTGRTPHAHVIERRLTRVEDALATTELPIATIAARCGFSSHAHMGSLFRARRGGTPSAWRRGHRG